MNYDIYSFLVFGDAFVGGVTVATPPEDDLRGEALSYQMIPANLMAELTLAEEDEEASVSMPQDYDLAPDPLSELVDAVVESGGAVMTASPVANEVAEVVGTSGDDVIFGSGSFDMDFVLETYFGDAAMFDAVVDAA